MYVLFDIEWIETPAGARNITQLAAARVDEHWAATATFSVLIKPEYPTDWTHIALTGATQHQFLCAPGEGAGIAQFLSWIRAEDILCCWQHEALDTIRAACIRHGAPEPLRRAFSLNRRLYSAARAGGADARCLHDLADWAGAEVVQPEHCSAKDVATLQNILTAMDVSQSDLAPAHIFMTKEESTLQKKKQKVMESLRYHYIYTPNSGIFHCKGCRAIQNAKVIFGCTYCRTARKKRRPCKICKPVEEIDPEQEALVSAPRDRDGGELLNVQLLGGQRTLVARKNIVGCCHNDIHPGKLTERIMEQHDCIGKQCRFFEKYAEASYWKKQQDACIQKQKRKAERTRRKMHQAADAGSIARLIDQFQSYADDAGYAMEIVDLKKEPNVYKLFYVSDHAFADGNCFPELLNTAYFHFPRKRIILRHIRDLDGHFVTIEEFNARTR